MWARFAFAMCYVLFVLSEADPTSPGTDKDVDYYQHKSTSMENYMPQRTGWESASDNKPVSGVTFTNSTV